MTKDKLEDEYREAWATWQAQPDPINTGTLLRQLDPVVSEAMRSYAGRSATSPTLKSKARRLALDALATYDPMRGRLRTHMLGQLQRLRRLTAQEQQIISLPERLSLDRNHLENARKELEDRLGRPPSDRELSDHTGLTKARLAHIRRAAAPIAQGTLLRYDEEGPVEPAVQPLAEPEQNPWVELIYDDLPARDQFIMERMLGLHGHQPMSATAVAKALGVTPGAISQRLVHIQQLLDRQEELGLFQ